MSTIKRRSVLIGLAGIATAVPFTVEAEPAQGGSVIHRPEINISGTVGLSSLITLGDGYLGQIADYFTLFATTPANTVTWGEFATPIAATAQRNVDALFWVAEPSGNYWTAPHGDAAGNLSHRSYFPDVLAGKTVIGPLVVSNATGKCVAIVAVPVRSINGAIAGVLGASVYLDELSQRLGDALTLGGGTIFYSFDASPILALEWDPSLIFVDPLTLTPEIRAAFEEMLSRSEGTVRYRFRNQWRTVIFRRSQITNWWYALGVVQGNAAAAK